MALAHKLFKKTSRLAILSPEARERLARSSRMFLLGLVIACGIEVAVDASSTLTEITTLRLRVSERGTSYAAVLTRALADPIVRRDTVEMERLATGVADDAEVVFVRATDTQGHVVFEHIASDYAAFFSGDRQKTFQAFYAHQLDRDARGVVDDPEGLRTRMESSRHRDIAQQWNDVIASIAARFGAGSKRAPESGAVVLFQDRLYVETPDRERDSSVTYAVGRVDDPAGKPVGAVIVAFDMRPTNASIRGKYLKGGGMVLFFVALIVVQNILGRREKLRLLDLDAKQRSAKEAIRGALPASLRREDLAVAGGFAPSARRIDGVVWDHAETDGAVDVIIVDPEGDGIDAAAVSLHVLAMIRRRRREGVRGSLFDEAAAAGEASLQVPLTRALGVMLVRVEGGLVEVLKSPVGEVRVLSDSQIVGLDEVATAEAPNGVVGPLRHMLGPLAKGSLLAIMADGLSGKAAADYDAIAGFMQRTRPRPTVDLASLVNDTVTWTRGRSPGLASSDIVVVAVST